ncbi:MAG: hypothetical protein HRU41_07805 [Saprospiraceae bacterium]|nr:hypothetical protein [Saprospiraceae bacterium]
MASFLLVFYAAALRFWGLVYTEPWEPAASGILSDWVYDQVGYAGIIPAIIATLLVFVEGWMLNALVLRDRLGRDANLFPGLFFILICSVLPPFLQLSPLHMANFFYILALFELFGIYKKSDCATNLFNSGLWIAIGSLFYPSYLALFVLIIVAINTLRSLKFRDILIVLSGILVPYIYALVYFYWTDRLSVFMGQQFPIQVGIPEMNFPDPTLYYISVVFSGLLLLVVLFSWGGFLAKNVIQVQKKINILYAALLFSVFAPFFVDIVSLDFLLYLAVPLGVLTSFSFTNMPNQRAEVIHLIWVVGLLYFHYLVFSGAL